MDVEKVTHEIRLQQWIGIIKECRSSGKTVKSWCEENGISEKSYFYWQRRAREAACQELTTYQEQQVAKAEPSESNTPVFTECRIPENHHNSGTAATIHLNGAVVEIHPGAEASIVESILHALRAPC
jgi:transposase-like protein